MGANADTADAERFRWWFSSEAKQVDINGYITGVNMRWNLDEWRRFVDAQRRACRDGERQ